MNCNICGAQTKPLYKAVILGRHKIQYYCCDECGFMQTEEPYWLEEAYSDAISISDTGVMARNNYFADVSKIILSILSNPKGKFLDFGGGYGIFTRLMRDKGFDFYWYDKYAKNLLARGFEGDINNSRYDVVTSFENFEHFLNPLDEIKTILGISDTILFSTELLPQDIPSPDKWWYYCLEHGQHISIFSMKTLEFIAKQNSLNFVSNGSNLHIFSKKPIPQKIFLFAKIIRKTGLSRLFNLESKTVTDMHLMIDGMQNK